MSFFIILKKTDTKDKYVTKDTTVLKNCKKSAEFDKNLSNDLNFIIVYSIIVVAIKFNFGAANHCVQKKKEG